MSIGISVIICCYNSEKKIAPTLEHLAKQDCDKEWEVIVVDNNSSDDTSKVAEDLCLKFGIEKRSRIVFQPVPGLTWAREKGIEVSKYEFVIFCDDDNWLEENYLKTAFRIMQENKLIGILGGKGEAKCESKEPIWFKQYQSHYAVGEQGEASGDITSRKYVWGAGMIIRRSVYINLRNSGFQSRMTDRKGSDLSSGGDSELSAMFVLCGYKLWYSSELKFIHFIQKERLTVPYRDKLLTGLTKSSKIIHQYFRLIDYYKVARENFWHRFWKVGELSLKIFFTKIMYVKKDNMRFYLSQLQLYLGASLKVYPFFYDVIVIRKRYIKSFSD